MKDTSLGRSMSSGDHEDQVEIVLEGGPAALPRTMRIGRNRSDERIKIQYLGGYEHFERVADVADGVVVPVFRWTARTRIAE